MKLENLWEKYNAFQSLNFSDFKEYQDEKFVLQTYLKDETIISQGDFPEYIYFIISGEAIGKRPYKDGNEFRYFEVNHEDGNLGLLELFSRNRGYVATITCLERTQVFKVKAGVIYDIIMNDIVLLRKAVHLLSQDLYSRSSNDGIYYYYSGIDRLRYFLIHYYDNHFEEHRMLKEIIVELSYEEIANQIGVSVRTVGRGIKELKKTNELIVYKKKVRIGSDNHRLLKKNIR